MKNDEPSVIPRLDPRETAGPFTIRISEAEMAGVKHRASLPRWKRWLFDWTPLWRWL